MKESIAAAPASSSAGGATGALDTLVKLALLALAAHQLALWTPATWTRAWWFVQQHAFTLAWLSVACAACFLVFRHLLEPLAGAGGAALKTCTWAAVVLGCVAVLGTAVVLLGVLLWGPKDRSDALWNGLGARLDDLIRFIGTAG